LAALLATIALGTAMMVRTATAGADAGDTVQVVDAGPLGSILAAGNGMTLYTFDRDGAGVSNCNGACLQAWPPYTVEGDLVAPEGLSGVLNIITRSDGSRQVTHNDRPLYFYAGDTQPGDTMGDGVGGIWHVVAP
jgi:predicted lipoprotein with Yx(FWY)xxD motif